MDRTRNWTDPRDGKLWILIRGLGMEVVFIRGGDRRTAPLHRLAELDSLTDKELEIRLDQAQRVRAEQVHEAGNREKGRGCFARRMESVRATKSLTRERIAKIIWDGHGEGRWALKWSEMAGTHAEKLCLKTADLILAEIGSANRQPDPDQQ